MAPFTFIMASLYVRIAKKYKIKTLKNIYILHLDTHGTYTDTKINNILNVNTSYRYYICALNIFTVLKTFNYPHSWLHRN